MKEVWELDLGLGTKAKGHVIHTDLWIETWNLKSDLPTGWLGGLASEAFESSTLRPQCSDTLETLYREGFKKQERSRELSSSGPIVNSKVKTRP